MNLDLIKENDKGHINEETDSFISNFVKILQDTRTLNAKTRKQKAATADSKVLLDKLYLDKQNLNYQAQYLRKEIAKCEQQETIYQDIEIYPVDKFLDICPENLSNDHELMQNRLKFELEERQRMVELAANIKEKRLSIGLELKKRSSLLESLETDLQNILKSTLGLQEKLELPISKDHDRNEKAFRLPTPLFVLYKKFYGYLSLQERLEELDVITYINSSSGQSDIYSPDESAVRILLQTEGVPYGAIKFSYLKNLKVVITDIELVDSFDYVPASYLLCELFSGDDGLNLQNPNFEYLDKSYFHFDVEKAKGCCFAWAQSLAGLEYPFHSLPSLSDNQIWAIESRKPFLEVILSRISERRQSMIRSNTILAGICAGKPLLNDNAISKRLKLAIAKPSVKTACCLNFSASFVFNEKKIVFDIVLSSSYPTKPCLFELHKDVFDLDFYAAVENAKGKAEAMFISDDPDPERLIQMQLLEFCTSLERFADKRQNS